jgi:SH3 domain-containing YSC84-like protein 1
MRRWGAPERRSLPACQTATSILPGAIGKLPNTYVSSGAARILREEVSDDTQITKTFSYCCAHAVGKRAVCLASSNPKPPDPRDQKDAEKKCAKAAEAFEEIMSVPEKAIPRSILDRAECVAVFPGVVKVGLVVGAQEGRGVASCRNSQNNGGWTSPAFFFLGGGSFGIQIGAQSTDFVLLFMNKHSIESLLADKFEIGAEGSVAAGPVGREVGASTDIKMNAEILSYSRSKGFFAGLDLKGDVIKPDKGYMQAAYRQGVTSSAVLTEQAGKANEALDVFPKLLSRYSPSRKE